MARAFLLAHGTRNERMITALREMVVPMLNGGLSTILAIVVLAGAKFPFFRTYYALMFIVMVIIAVLNGLVFLPVVLSLIGPPSSSSSLDARVSPDSRDDSVDDLERQKSSLALKPINNA